MFTEKFQVNNNELAEWRKRINLKINIFKIHGFCATTSVHIAKTKTYSTTEKKTKSFH